MRPVIVVGDLMADVVASAAAPLAHASDTPARITHRPGGGGANVAARLVEQGVPALLVARVGEDTPGRAAVEDLRRAGVELEVAVDALNATRDLHRDRGAGRRAHHAPRPGRERGARAERPARSTSWPRAGTSTSPGTRCSTPARGPPPWWRWSTRARPACRSRSTPPRRRHCRRWAPTTSSAGRASASLLLPNAEEAAVLSGARDPEAAAWVLARDGREVVITLGKDGALWSEGERVERARASPAPAPVDSTAAPGTP